MMRRKTLGPAAWGRTMATMEKGRERTRYPLTIDIAIRKNLQTNFCVRVNNYC